MRCWFLTAPTNKFVGFQVGSPQGYFGAIASRHPEECSYAGDQLGSMTDVAYWWRKKAGRDFSQLNITGNDTFTSMERCGWLFTDIGVIPRYKRVCHLRRYQVLDEDDRSVDIRTWPKSVWEWAPSYPPCYWPCGFKNNHHRTTGPSMWRGTYRASMDGLDEAELLEENLPLPIQDNTGVRLPFNGTDRVWDY